MKQVDFHDRATQRAFSLAAAILIDFPGIEAPVMGIGLAEQAFNNLLSPYLAGPATLDIIRAWRPLNSDQGLKVEPKNAHWIDDDNCDGMTYISILIERRQSYQIRLDHVPILFSMLLPVLPEKKEGGDVHNYRRTDRGTEKRLERAWQVEMVKRRMHVIKMRKFGLVCTGMSGNTYEFEPSPMAALNLINAPDEHAFVSAMNRDALMKTTGVGEGGKGTAEDTQNPHDGCIDCGGTGWSGGVVGSACDVPRKR